MKHKLVKRILTAGLAAAVAVTAVPLTGLEGLFDSLKVRAAEEVREPMVISEDTTLKDVTIQGKEGQSAVKIQEGAHVTLTIEGTVRLTGGDAYYTSNHWGVLLQNGAGEPLTVGIDIHSSHGAGGRHRGAGKFQPDHKRRWYADLPGRESLGRPERRNGAQ